MYDMTRYLERLNTKPKHSRKLPIVYYISTNISVCKIRVTHANVYIFSSIISCRFYLKTIEYQKLNLKLLDSLNTYFNKIIYTI